MRPILALLLLGFLPLTARENPKVLAHQVVDQVNWARQHPKEVAAALRAWLPLFEGDRYLAFPGEPRLRTQEGSLAVREAIDFLERQQPVDRLKWSDRLGNAAESLAKDQASHGGLGHEASDGSMPWDRIKRFGKAASAVGEVVTYGTFGEPGDPRRAVLSLIVDDGVADRGHRIALFNPDYKLAGAAWGPHPEYTRMVVVDFADGFVRGDGQ